jgi:hypothetical protein
MDGNRDDSQEPSGYEPPKVEDLPVQDDTLVVAAGISKSPPPVGPEWRPSGADVQTSGPESP